MVRHLKTNMKTIPIISALFLHLAALTAQVLPPPTNPPPVISLTWDLVPGVTYKLYYGAASGAYTNVVTVGATNFATVTLPARGVQFYFAVTATSNSLESVFSNEVSYTAPQPPAAPTGLKPPVVITVQYKNSLMDFQWSDLFSQPVDPTQPFQAFRLAIVVGPDPVPQLRSINTVKLPPLPGK
jgi:hypothetical protein